MAVKQRAVAEADKEERRNAILDAAEALFNEQPSRVANVAEVAEAAGLAKGTVYLYFPSKEEMLLALHERHVARFFSEVMRLLDGGGRVDFDAVFEVTRKHFIRAPGCLALTSRCFGLMDREIPLETALAFKIRVAQTLAAAGVSLERHFPALAAGQGIVVFLHSYGLIIGLWQLLHPNERFGAAMNRPDLKLIKRDYERDIESALRALWSGMTAGDIPATPPEENAMKQTLTLAALAAVLAACGGSKTVTEPVRPVITQKVTAGAAASRDVYSGEVRARYETDLGFRIAGKILKREVDAGARVKKGQVLARLDPEDAKLAADAARAQTASSESDLALAKAELDRSADLLEKKFISQSAYDVKQNVYAAAKARHDQMKSQAAISTNQAGYTTLTADADGVVLVAMAEPGQVVTAGQAVLKLAHAGEKDVVLNAPEGQLARFRVGEDVGISLWSDPQTVFRGRIREVAGGADPVTRTYTVKVAAIDPPPNAQIGMTANVLFIPTVDAGLTLLPLGAIAGDREAPAVWVVDPKTSAVQLRRVKLGAFREDGATVLEGLAPGEVVVTAGVHKLRAGQVVRLASSS